MPITVKIEPIARDLELIISEELSPAAQSNAFAEFAEAELKEAQETNRTVLGRVPPHEQFVDGVKGARLEGVRPNGVIAFEFELAGDILLWIAETLVENSPVGSGRDPHPGLYRSSHTLFVDGRETEIGQQLPVADEYVFINMLDYARKIEAGQSPQFPDGVYEATAVLARRRFGSQAQILFTYRGVVGGQLYGKSGPRPRTTAKAGRSRRPAAAQSAANVRFPAIIVRPRSTEKV